MSGDDLWRNKQKEGDHCSSSGGAIFLGFSETSPRSIPNSQLGRWGGVIEGAGDKPHGLARPGARVLATAGSAPPRPHSRPLATHGKPRLFHRGRHGREGRMRRCCARVEGRRAHYWSTWRGRIARRRAKREAWDVASRVPAHKERTKAVGPSRRAMRAPALNPTVERGQRRKRRDLRPAASERRQQYPMRQGARGGGSRACLSGERAAWLACMGGCVHGHGLRTSPCSPCTRACVHAWPQGQWRMRTHTMHAHAHTTWHAHAHAARSHTHAVNARGMGVQRGARVRVGELGTTHTHTHLMHARAHTRTHARTHPAPRTHTVVVQHAHACLSRACAHTQDARARTHHARTFTHRSTCRNRRH
jgi:hypothetical protein